MIVWFFILPQSFLTSQVEDTMQFYSFILPAGILTKF